MIRALFDEAVVDIVVACTDASAEARAAQADPETTRANWYARKRAHLDNAIDADDKVLLVMACEKLHNARAIVQDLENPAVGQAVFERFNGGRDGTLAYYHSPAHVFAPRAVPVAGAFENAVGRSHQLAGHAPALTQALLVESHRERAAAWGVGVR